MSKPFLKVQVSEEEKERIKNYLESTYNGSISELVRRLVFEKVAAWEQHEEDRQYRRAQLEAS